MTHGHADRGRFRHEAGFYRDADEYRALVLPFIRDGLAGGAAVFVALPGDGAGIAAAGLDGLQEQVAFGDMTRIGRNPGRLISAICDFADRHPGRQVRFVAELVWPGRSAAEIREATAQEAIMNSALAGSRVAVLCPFNAARLAPEVIADAQRTHPLIRGPRGAVASAGYDAGLPLPGTPLAPPPAGTRRLAYTADLRAVRDFVAAGGTRAGLSEDRTADLVLAAGELAANTFRHTAAGGEVQIWRTDGEVICQVSDQGEIDDPLAGLRRPEQAGGLGLWVVHQVCDLVELRTGPRGTVVRMHMLLGSQPGESGNRVAVSPHLTDGGGP